MIESQIEIFAQQKANRAVALLLLAQYRHHLRKPQLVIERNAETKRNIAERRELIGAKFKAPTDPYVELSEEDEKVLKMSWLEWLGYKERPDLATELSEAEMSEYDSKLKVVRWKMENEPQAVFIPLKQSKK